MPMRVSACVLSRLSPREPRDACYCQGSRLHMAASSLFCALATQTLVSNLVSRVNQWLVEGVSSRCRAGVELASSWRRV